MLLYCGNVPAFDGLDQRWRDHLLVGFDHGFEVGITTLGSHNIGIMKLFEPASGTLEAILRKGNGSRGHFVVATPRELLVARHAQSHLQEIRLHTVGGVSLFDTDLGQFVDTTFEG